MGNHTDISNNPTDEIVGFFLFYFVKIILLKRDNCALALRKRLFYDAKPTLLPCKTAAFGLQNNRFCKVLIDSYTIVMIVKNIYIPIAFFSFIKQREFDVRI